MGIAYRKYLGVAGNIIVSFVVEAQATATCAFHFQLNETFSVRKGKNGIYGDISQRIHMAFAIQPVDYPEEFRLPDKSCRGCDEILLQRRCQVRRELPVIHQGNDEAPESSFPFLTMRQNAASVFLMNDQVGDFVHEYQEKHVFPKIGVDGDQRIIDSGNRVKTAQFVFSWS